jgi:hypothetical protein
VNTENDFFSAPGFPSVLGKQSISQSAANWHKRLRQTYPLTRDLPRIKYACSQLAQAYFENQTWSHLIGMPTSDHSFSDHSFSDHSFSDHSFSDHSFSDHSFSDHSTLANRFSLRIPFE